MQPDRDLLPDLGEVPATSQYPVSSKTNKANILSQRLRILTIPRRLEGLVQREGHVTGDGEVVESGVDQGLLRSAAPHHTSYSPIILSTGATDVMTYLLRLPRRHARLDLAQTLADEQDAVDEHAVGGALDLEVPEEGIGAEEGEDLVDAVVRLAVRVDVGLVGARGQRGEGVCGAARASAEREEGEVSCRRSAVWGFCL